MDIEGQWSLLYDRGNFVFFAAISFHDSIPHRGKEKVSVRTIFFSISNVSSHSDEAKKEERKEGNADEFRHRMKLRCAMENLEEFYEFYEIRGAWTDETALQIFALEKREGSCNQASKERRESLSSIGGYNGWLCPFQGLFSKNYFYVK